METIKLRADLAVMNALRDFDAGPGSAIDFDRLAQRWPEYGLRSSDLPEAVQRLARRGLLHVQAAEKHARICASRTGQEWADSQPAWLEYSLLAPRREQYQLHLMPGFAPLPTSMERRAQGHDGLH